MSKKGPRTRREGAGRGGAGAGAGVTGAGSDRHVLYEDAVQCVEAEIDFVDRVFLKERGRRAVLLREDFCGTAASSCEWVRRRGTNRAVGLDIDAATLAWGLRHNVGTLTEGQRGRVELRRQDVLTAVSGGFDVVLAMNFSYWCFHTREVMLRYFRAVRKSLGPEGVFCLDFYGGPDAMRVTTERRRKKGYTYVWDQHAYSPITGRISCAIHFEFPGGRALRNAFRYEWRQWHLPELRDVLTDAGFARTAVYWEGDDGKGGGNGVFRESEKGDACEAFICYIVAVK